MYFTHPERKTINEQCTELCGADCRIFTNSKCARLADTRPSLVAIRTFWCKDTGAGPRNRSDVPAEENLVDGLYAELPHD